MMTSLLTKIATPATLAAVLALCGTAFGQSNSSTQSPSGNEEAHFGPYGYPRQMAPSNNSRFSGYSNGNQNYGTDYGTGYEARYGYGGGYGNRYANNNRYDSGYGTGYGNRYGNNNSYDAGYGSGYGNRYGNNNSYDYTSGYGNNGYGYGNNTSYGNGTNYGSGYNMSTRGTRRYFGGYATGYDLNNW